RYYGPVRLPAGAPAGYVFPVRVLLSLRRVSQVPRLICPRALPPFTPSGPAVALARFFTADAGFIQFGRLAIRSLCHEADSGSLSLRLTCLPHEASPSGLLLLTLAWLLVQRAINKMHSSQYTRSARLILALRIARMRHETTSQ